MGNRSIGGLVHVGLDIIATAVNKVTNKITAQTGNAIKQTTDANAVEWWQHVGFVSRPSQPVAGKSAAQGVVLKTSDRDAVVASQDVRGLAIYGNLKDGETCVYASGEDGQSQGRALFKSDGSVTLYTTDDNTPTGKTVALRISPTGGFEFTSQWGSMVLDETGFHVKTAAGPRIDVGSITVPGVPAAVSGAFTGYAKMTAPTVQMEGANCVLGMGPVFNQAVGGFSSTLIGGGPVPLGIADLSASALFASNTVWVST